MLKKCCAVNKKILWKGNYAVWMRLRHVWRCVPCSRWRGCCSLWGYADGVFPALFVFCQTRTAVWLNPKVVVVAVLVVFEIMVAMVAIKRNSSTVCTQRRWNRKRILRRALALCDRPLLYDDPGSQQVCQRTFCQHIPRACARQIHSYTWVTGQCWWCWWL